MRIIKYLDLNGVKIPLQRTVVHGHTGTGKTILLQLFKHQIEQNHIDVVYIEGKDLKTKISDELESRKQRDCKRLMVVIIDHLELHDFNIEEIDILLSDSAVEYGIIGIVSSQTLLLSDLFSKIGVSLNGNQITMLNNNGDYSAEIKTFIKLNCNRRVINRPALN